MQQIQIAIGDQTPTSAAWKSLPIQLAPHLGLTSPRDGLFTSLAGPDPIDQIRFAHEYGFSAVEDNFLRQRLPVIQARMGEELAARGMMMGCFLGTMTIDRQTFVVNDAEVRARIVSNLKQSIETAKRVGGRYLTCILGQRDLERSCDIQTMCAIETLKYCVDLAERANVVLLVEAISRHRFPDILVSRVDHAVEICRAVASPAVRIVFDVYQCQRETGDLFSNLDRAWDLVECVQIADNPGRAEPGTGEINFVNFFRHLCKKGYNGLVEMEHCVSNPGREGELAVLAAYERLCRAI